MTRVYELEIPTGTSVLSLYWIYLKYEVSMPFGCSKHHLKVKFRKFQFHFFSDLMAGLIYHPQYNFAKPVPPWRESQTEMRCDLCHISYLLSPVFARTGHVSLPVWEIYSRGGGSPRSEKNSTYISFPVPPTPHNLLIKYTGK